MNGPRVAILLCVCDAEEEFLLQQLLSIVDQHHKNISLWISDDSKNSEGLTDFLSVHKERLPFTEISILNGPRKNFSDNFLSLICHDEIKADYFAFCDQDDVWEPDKLTRALEKLANISDITPAVYCSRTCLVDENNNKIGFSNQFKKPPSFSNALVQNIGGGNTMVLNCCARVLLKTCGARSIVSHDWWSYQVVSGAGGVVIYDSDPKVLYRQHQRNLVGSNGPLLARVKRMRKLLKGSYRDWNSKNIIALSDISNHLLPKNKEILDYFSYGRDQLFFLRVYWLIFKARLHRQTFLGNVGLYVAIILGKV